MAKRIAIAKTVTRPRSVDRTRWTKFRALVAATARNGKAVSIDVDRSEVVAARASVAANRRLRALGVVRTQFEGQTLTAWIESAR